MLKSWFSPKPEEPTEEEQQALDKQRILTDDEAKGLVRKMKRVFIGTENKLTYRETGSEVENDADIYITLPPTNRPHRTRVYLGKGSDIDFKNGYIYVKDPDGDYVNKYEPKIINNTDNIKTGLFLHAIPPPREKFLGLFGGKTRRRRRNRSTKRRPRKSKSYV